MHYQFREAASAFQMIDGYMQVPIIVRYNENDKLINSLRAIGPKRDIMRLLQRYTVNVPRQRITDLLQKGMIEEMGVPPNYNEPSGIYVQTAPSVYHADIGLDIFGEGLKTEDYQI
jgi:CRISPR-associated endonuclease/helicase Cas3